MIKELIFILVLIVVILCAIAARPSSILRADKSHLVDSVGSVEKLQEKMTEPPRKKSNKTTRVRFSPEKKERTYSVKTGEILVDRSVKFEDNESEN